MSFDILPLHREKELDLNLELAYIAKDAELARTQLELKDLRQSSEREIAELDHLLSKVYQERNRLQERVAELGRVLEAHGIDG